MMCQEYQELLTLYLLGDLEAGRAAPVRAHLETCAACRAAADELERTLDLMRSMFAVSPAAPAQLDAAHRRKVLRAKFRWWPLPWQDLAKVAAVLLLSAGILSALLLPATQRARKHAQMIGTLSRGQGVEVAALAKSIDGPSGADTGAALLPRSEAPSVAPAEKSARSKVDFDDDRRKPAGGRETEDRLHRNPVKYAQEDRAREERPDEAGRMNARDAIASTSRLGVSDKDGGESRRRIGGGTPDRATSPAKSPDDAVHADQAQTAGHEVNTIAKSGSGTRVGARELGHTRTPPAREPMVALRAERQQSMIVGTPVPIRVPNLDAAEPRYGYAARKGNKELDKELEKIQLAKNAPQPGTRQLTEDFKPGEGSEGKGTPPGDGKLYGGGGSGGEAGGIDIAGAVQGPLILKGIGHGAYSGLLGDGRAGSKGSAAEKSAGFKSADESQPASDSVALAVNKTLASDLAYVPAKPEEKQELARKLGDSKAKPAVPAAGVNPWVAAAAQPFSTFAIDGNTASYTLSRNYMLKGSRPPPEAVRTEEFVNFFDYAYAPPASRLFAVHAAAAPTPFGAGTLLLKLGVKGRHLGREQQQHARLTFVIDTSGSMNAPDRLVLARRALRLLVERLNPADSVAIVQYDARARLVLDFTPAAQQQKILGMLDRLQAAGFTHLEEGLKLGYATAARGFASGAANRVILLTDGVANVGAATAEDILKQVAQYRQQGLYCSVFGLGLGTYDDALLQALANKGNGAYFFMDSIDEARRVFVDDLAATLNVIASDVKIQVEFNPRRVKQYRPLGYESRQLKKEDFRNDAVGAGQVGSGQAVTALYEIELQGRAEEPIGVVRVRGRNSATGLTEETEQAITAAQTASAFDKAGVHFRLAAAAAEFAELLRGSPYAAGNSFADVTKALRPVALELSLDQRVQELLRLVQSAGSLPPAPVEEKKDTEGVQ